MIRLSRHAGAAGRLPGVKLRGGGVLHRQRLLPLVIAMNVTTAVTIASQRRGNFEHQL
jgi:hypothetical protein